VASLLAIAAVGAIVAAQFHASLDDRLAGKRLTPAEMRAVEAVRDEPLVGHAKGAPELDGDVRAASVRAYRAGVRVAAGLVALGGLISLIGIANPPRRCAEAPEERRAAATPA
jgi:hypothetical protein